MRAARLVLTLLLLSRPAAAAELKLATWNLEWLTARPAGDPALPRDVRPKAAADVDRLREYAARLDADVVAFQEVDGPEVAARVFPPDRYAVFTTADPVVQRVGFAVRRTIAARQNPDLVALDVTGRAGEDGALPLRSGADVTLSVDGTTLRLLAVHLKTGCQRGALGSVRAPCATLGRQVPPLQGWIARRRADGEPFVLLGDFNRVMDPAAAGPEEMLSALDASAGGLRRATEGRASPCWGKGGFIDHILAGGAARGWMRPDSLRVLTYAEQADTDQGVGAPGWRQRLSDHCPVSVRLALPDG